MATLERMQSNFNAMQIKIDLILKLFPHVPLPQWRSGDRVGLLVISELILRCWERGGIHGVGLFRRCPFACSKGRCRLDSPAWQPMASDGSDQVQIVLRWAVCVALSAFGVHLACS